MYMYKKQTTKSNVETPLMKNMMSRSRGQTWCDCLVNFPRLLTED